MANLLPIKTNIEVKIGDDEVKKCAQVWGHFSLTSLHHRDFIRYKKCPYITCTMMTDIKAVV
jgi:hypothetical protein